MHNKLPLEQIEISLILFGKIIIWISVAVLEMRQSWAIVGPRTEVDFFIFHSDRV